MIAGGRVPVQDDAAAVVSVGIRDRLLEMLGLAGVPGHALVNGR